MSSEKVCLRFVCKAAEALNKHLLWLFSSHHTCSTILNFQTSFFKTSGISILLVRLDWNLYASSKRVEIVWYERSCGSDALIRIYDLLKFVPFFWDLPIYISALQPAEFHLYRVSYVSFGCQFRFGLLIKYSIMVCCLLLQEVSGNLTISKACGHIWPHMATCFVVEKFMWPPHIVVSP